MLRATTIVRAPYVLGKPWATVTLDAGARHLRRKLLTLADAGDIMIDLAETTKLKDRDCLCLEDGRLVQVIASDEDLLEVTARDATHLLQLAWHIGNRHLEAQVDAARIVIRRDHVIESMLRGLGATLREVNETFTPEHGAYGHGH